MTLDCPPTVTVTCAGGRTAESNTGAHHPRLHRNNASSTCCTGFKAHAQLLYNGVRQGTKGVGRFSAPTSKPPPPPGPLCTTSEVALQDNSVHGQRPAVTPTPLLTQLLLLARSRPAMVMVMGELNDVGTADRLPGDARLATRLEGGLQTTYGPRKENQACIHQHSRTQGDLLGLKLSVRVDTKQTCMIDTWGLHLTERHMVEVW